MEIQPFAASLGADVLGADLSKPLSGRDFRAIHDAFLEHHVLAIRGQALDRAAQLAFARRFGEPEVHPIVEGTEEHPDVIRVFKPAGSAASFGVGWHSDNTFFESPSLGTVLYGEIIPPVGGDTLYASMEAAWEGLSAPMQARLDGLRGIHSARRAYDPELVGREKYEGDGPLTYRYSDAVKATVTHPLVRTHPETGRKSLFVNPMFTTAIEGFARAESQALLALLFEHAVQPEYTCRLRWEPGTVAMWDNRCVQHYAMDDYREHDRLMWRVTLAGDRPK
jgi:taurine dioxygenase